MDYDDATRFQRRRAFPRRYVVERAMTALLAEDLDLSAVRADSRSGDLGLDASFITLLAADFGWSNVAPGFQTLGDVADFFAANYRRDVMIGRRMHSYGGDMWAFD